jgi:hypothetical protein
MKNLGKAQAALRLRLRLQTLHSVCSHVAQLPPLTFNTALTTRALDETKPCMRSRPIRRAHNPASILLFVVFGLLAAQIPE